MNQFEINEAQEWQLFELLEGNLSPQEASKLHQEIAAQPALAYHFSLLKQTYTAAPEIEFPNPHLLKKQPRNKQVYLWISSAAAAVIMVLLLWKPNSSIKHREANGHAQAKPGKEDAAISNETASIANQLTPLDPSSHAYNHQITVNSHQKIQPNTSINNKNAAIHPLITATNDFRGNRNDSQQQRNVNTKIETEHAYAEQQLTMGENHKIEPLPTPFGTQQTVGSRLESGPLFSPSVIPPSAQPTKAIFVKNSLPRKNGLALAKSFYNDGKTMIQNGHVPHVKIRTINKSRSLIPTIEMGVRLENNVIMASFNQ